MTYYLINNERGFPEKRLKKIEDLLKEYTQINFGEDTAFTKNGVTYFEIFGNRRKVSVDEKVLENLDSRQLLLKILKLLHPNDVRDALNRKMEFKKF